MQEEADGSDLSEDEDGCVQSSSLMTVDHVTHAFPPDGFPEHYSVERWSRIKAYMYDSGRRVIHLGKL